MATLLDVLNGANFLRGGCSRNGETSAHGIPFGRFRLHTLQAPFAAHQLSLYPGTGRAQTATLLEHVPPI